ncbi:MAG: hypothetical protein V4534_00815 [Myxococcota bacterium]
MSNVIQAVMAPLMSRSSLRAFIFALTALSTLQVKPANAGPDEPPRWFRHNPYNIDGKMVAALPRAMPEANATVASSSQDTIPHEVEALAPVTWAEVVQEKPAIFRLTVQISKHLEPRIYGYAGLKCPEKVLVAWDIIKDFHKADGNFVGDVVGDIVGDVSNCVRVAHPSDRMARNVTDDEVQHFESLRRRKHASVTSYFESSSVYERWRMVEVLVFTGFKTNTVMVIYTGEANYQFVPRLASYLGAFVRMKKVVAQSLDR